MLEDYISILSVIVWPAVVVMALIFFRKVVTFLFFSIEEFNFFGAKGRLKNVQELIAEKASQEVERREREHMAKRRINELEEGLHRLKERTKNKDRLAFLVEELIKENNELWDDIREKEDEYESITSTKKDTAVLQSEVAMLREDMAYLKKNIASVGSSDDSQSAQTKE